MPEHVLTAAPPLPPAVEQPALRSLDDIGGLRKNIAAGVLQGLTNRFPVENERYRLELSDLSYEPKDYTLAEQKDAILRGRTLANPVKGNWQLVDRETGQPVDQARRTVTRIPYINQQGAYIYNGHQYTISNQARLRPGAYTRRRESGELETHFNVKPRTGRSFRLMLEPDTGIFRMHVGQARLRLLPILRRMGMTDTQLRKAWGNDLFAANAKKDDTTAYDKALARLGSSRSKASAGEKVPTSLLEVLAKSEMDEDVTTKTLGQPHKAVTPDVLLRATNKLINVSRGDEEVDDRDSMEFQEIRDASDLFRERIERDAGMLVRRLLWRATYAGNLKSARTGYLADQLDSAIYQSGLGVPLEEINPTELMDKNLRLVRLGEGGISSVDSVPESSRNVQPSQFSVIDPIVSPESMKIGIDLRTAINTFKGADGQIYSSMVNAKTGEEERVSARDLANAVVAFPGEMEKGGTKVRAMNLGKLDSVPRNNVDYVLPHASEMFTASSNLVPMISAIKGQRLMMGAKMATQALPLKDAEAPLVQSETKEGGSFEHKYGDWAGAVKAKAPGRVVSMDAGQITVRQTDGKERTYELYDNFPYNRKTYQHNTPAVSVGDMVMPGDLLARSNYTDEKGTLALGKNLRVAYLPWRGNFEDAIVISESAAGKLSSEHMYNNELELDEGIKTGRDEFSVAFPTKYSRDQLAKVDREGAVQPGTTVSYGDPLILATKARKPRPGDKLFRRKVSDQAVEWDHQHDGVVTDVIKGKDGIKVYVKALSPMEVGDKMSGRHADKGVVREIVPDNEMPRDTDGNPMDIVLNPLGIVTRVNPAQLYEAALGKIADKRGEPYVLPSFTTEPLAEFVESELKRHNMKDTENLIDPATGKKLKDVFVGNRFFMKLHHTAESKESARDIGAYTMDMTPAKGGAEGAKRIGGMEMNALVSHGASEVIRDIKNIRGQRNDDFWRAFRLGYAPPTPQIPYVYEKFVAMLQAAGVNVQKKGNTTNIMALTDRDVDKLSGGEITNAETVDFKTFEPVKGGLFDRGIFGGHDGRRWGHITLAEPLPNPVMEDTTRRLLDLTKNKFRDVLAGREKLNGRTGGEAIYNALRRIKIDRSIEEQRHLIASGRKSKRDAAVKKLGFLNMMKKTGIRPEDLVMRKVPVLPTAFRPVSAFKDMNLVTDANFLYKDLLEANQAYGDINSELGRTHSGDERLTLYDAFKAVSGLGDPIKSETQQKQVRGMLKQIFGGSPKFGTFQRQVMAAPVDIVGRATVTPDPGLDMDHVGLPEERAWTVYRPFVIRRLVRSGVAPTQAVKMVMGRDARAKRAMIEEMAVRPVIVNRNPTLHKYGIMAAFPILVKGRTLRVSPTTVGGFGMDFDGDAAQYHVPVSEQARRETIERMLPSKNLLSQDDFEVHYVPKMEYALGLYLASSAKGRKSERTFKGIRDVIAAFARGDIDLDARVNIPGA